MYQRLCTILISCLCTCLCTAVFLLMVSQGPTLLSFSGFILPCGHKMLCFQLRKVEKQRGKLSNFLKVLAWKRHILAVHSHSCCPDSVKWSQPHVSLVLLWGPLVWPLLDRCLCAQLHKRQGQHDAWPEREVGFDNENGINSVFIMLSVDTCKTC